MRVGENIDAAKIIAIESNSAHLRVANRSFAMRVGSSLIRDSQYANDFETNATSIAESTTQSKSEPVVDVDTDHREPVASTLETKSLPPKASTAENVAVIEPDLPGFAKNQEVYGPIVPGDALSGIAKDYAIQDITLNQVMLAIYAANPTSFGGNLNLLYAYEILEILVARDFRKHDAQAALTEVARHAASWHDRYQPLNST